MHQQDRLECTNTPTRPLECQRATPRRINRHTSQRCPLTSQRCTRHDTQAGVRAQYDKGTRERQGNTRERRRHARDKEAWGATTRRKDGEKGQTGSLQGCISLDLSQTHTLHQVGHVIDTHGASGWTSHVSHSHVSPVTFDSSPFTHPPQCCVLVCLRGCGA